MGKLHSVSHHIIPWMYKGEGGAIQGGMDGKDGRKYIFAIKYVTYGHLFTMVNVMVPLQVATKIQTKAVTMQSHRETNKCLK